LILRIGIFLSRETFSKRSGEDLVSFSLLRLIDRKLILEKALNIEFKEKRATENSLKLEKMIVKPRYQDDIIAYSFKSVLSSLEVLDYMTFDEINNPTLEVEFKKDLETLIMEGFLKNRRNIDDSIIAMLNILSDSVFYNLKSLYVKVAVNDVIQAFSNYLNGNASNSNIKQSTLESMNIYLKNNLDIIIKDKKIIEDYLEVWNYIYNPNSEESLIEKAILNEGLKVLLK